MKSLDFIVSKTIDGNRIDFYTEYCTETEMHWLSFEVNLDFGHCGELPKATRYKILKLALLLLECAEKRAIESGRRSLLVVGKKLIATTSIPVEKVFCYLVVGKSFILTRENILNLVLTTSKLAVILRI